MFKQMRQMRQMAWEHRCFKRVSRDAVDRTRIVMTMAVMHDLRPSVARELFATYCQQNPTQDWRACGRHLMTTASGMSWMTEQIATRGRAI